MTPILSTVLIPLLWISIQCLHVCAVPVPKHVKPGQKEVSQFLTEYYDGSGRDSSPIRRSSRSLENVTSCDICGPMGLDVDMDKNLFDPDQNTTYTCWELAYYYNTLSADSEECSSEVLSYLAPQCCDMSGLPPKYQCETNVRSQILGSSYDIAVPPSVNFDPLNLNAMIDFFHITDIDLKSSTVEVFVWLTLNWIDPRLAWNISNENCVNQISLHASMDVDKTDVWVPELNLYNRFSGLEGFGDAMATVNNEGRVNWVRDGGLRALCSFVGLKQMPFDELGCAFSFGVKSRHDISVSLQKLGEDEVGVDGVRFPHYIQTYNEYKVIKEKTSSSPFGLGFMVRFFFRRADRHYLLFVLVPNILFTYLAFGQFLLKTSDRVGYGVNMMLVLVAQGIITAEILPICNEQLWINTMNLVSMIFTVAALGTSLLLGHLYSKIDDDESKKQRDGKATSSDAQSGEESDNNEVDEKIEKMMEATSKFALHLSYQKTKLLDKICMILFFSTYTIILIVYYSGNKNWTDNADEIWT